MPVLYKPFQSNLEDKKSGKKLFYPHVVRTGNINSAQLSKEIAAYSSLSPGDVKNTLDNLVTVMAQHLQSSESVSVDGLGTFRMVMSARGRGVECCTGYAYRPLPAYHDEESGPYHRYPFYGDGCQVCPL